MALSFPNRSRSYDATLRAVRFWGHDGAMEASFFVNEEALKRIQPGLQADEAGLLSAFGAGCGAALRWQQSEFREAAFEG